MRGVDRHPANGPGAGMDPGARTQFETGIKSMIAETLQTVGSEDTLACVSATLGSSYSVRHSYDLRS